MRGKNRILYFISILSNFLNKNNNNNKIIQVVHKIYY